jgi:hypothetical protein
MSIKYNGVVPRLLHTPSFSGYLIKQYNNFTLHYLHQILLCELMHLTYYRSSLVSLFLTHTIVHMVVHLKYYTLLMGVFILKSAGEFGERQYSMATCALGVENVVSNNFLEFR